MSDAIECGIYEHFKGMRYQVHGVVKHSESLETMVLYQALYGEHGFWVRPLAMFKETVTRDGDTFPRFKLIEARPSPITDIH